MSSDLKKYDSDRFTAWKHKGKNLNAMRQGRVNTTVELRKQKQESVIAKRRNLPNLDNGDNDNINLDEQNNNLGADSINGGLDLNNQAIAAQLGVEGGNGDMGGVPQVNPYEGMTPQQQ